MTHTVRIAAVLAGVVLLGGSAAWADDVKPKDAASHAGSKNQTCPPPTGSRIAVKSSHCPQVGRSYSNTDIKLTGATSPSEALRLMDSSVKVNP
jgi:hypothetical protein